MKDVNALFVGMYPNVVSPYRNVFFQNLIFAMADMGVDCTVISPVPITKYRLDTRKIEYKTIHKTPKGAKVTVYYPWYISASSKQIGSFNSEKLSEIWFENSAVRIVKTINKKFDFVYGHFFLYGGLAAIKIGKILNIPSFFAYGECDFDSQVRRTYGVPKKEQLEGLSGVISVSSKNTNELKNLGILEGVPIITAPNSTNLAIFYPKNKIECRKKLGMPLNKFIVGFVGGFIDRKGDKRLLAAINNLDNIYAAFAGRGDPAPVGEKVVFCKALDHNIIPDFLNAIDVFCLPTLSEGSCNAIVEAAACGKPIISSDLSFNDDLLNNNNSIRVNPKSINEIADAICKLYNDAELRARLSKQIEKDAMKFTIEKRCEIIFNFIYRCISEKY